MVGYRIIEAQPWHCGQMARILRQDHQKALAMLGIPCHAQLRSMFDDSSYRRACEVDGKLIALWGVSGPALAYYGVVWLALAGEIKKYPIALIKEVRRQLDEIMQIKRLLICTLLEDDEASHRFAIFLGFVPTVGEAYVLPAETRFGRLEVARQLKEAELIPAGTGHVRFMSYKGI
jgi:hypothetical protein